MDSVKKPRKHVRLRATRNRPRMPDGRLAPMFQRIMGRRNPWE